MTAIEPMLLTETDDESVLANRRHVFQVEENGHRAIVHVKEGRIVGIRNRGNNPVLYLYPELKNYKETTVTVTEAEPNEKGTKIHGMAQVDGKEVLVECQMAGMFSVPRGSQHKIRYLDRYRNRLIQPTKAG